MNSLLKAGKAFLYAVDVTDSRQVQNMVGEAVAKFGKIDILVNNAGGVSGAKSESEAKSKGKKKSGATRIFRKKPGTRL